jgi:hypothetical protein
MADNSFPIYSTEWLLGAYGVIDRPSSFLLDLFFPYEQTFETEKVAFDKVERARRLAPFVSANVPGQPMRQPGFQARDFAPAYVKPMHVVDMNRPFKRRAGERLLGQLSPLERYNLAVADNLEEEDREITRREEWMAAQILLNGAMVVQGPKFPTMLVDFGRPSAQTIVLTGANRWGQVGVSPMATLRATNQQIMLSSGYNASVVVMDPLAESLFVADPEVKEILDSRVNTPIGENFRLGNINLAGVNAGAVGEEVKYLGQIGEFHIFVYQNVYVNEDGTLGSMLPPNTVLMGSPKGFQGTRLYGAIKDKRAGLKALPRFPKMWDMEDPSATFTQTQSAPLPVSGWPEASASLTVA